MRNLNGNPVNTIFLGSGWESVATLNSLNEDSRFNIVGVITTTDKPVGRKHIMTPSDVKAFALDNDIAIFHTDGNKDKYQEALDLFKPELIVCKAFGEIIPEFFLEYPKYKSINVHFSLLPKYRGAVPIQKAILDGESKTGISIMLMSAGLDEGDVLDMYEEQILPKDTNQTLRERLVLKSAEILGDILAKWVNNEITPVEQDSSKATFCWQKDISKENAQIDWDTMEPEYIERMTRAFLPWPVAWTIWEGKRIKLFETELVELKNSNTPGTLFKDDNRLLFSTLNNEVCLQVNELQVEGKQRISANEFLNGF